MRYKSGTKVDTYKGHLIPLCGFTSLVGLPEGFFWEVLW